jgi:uncharacterized membrane protein
MEFLANNHPKVVHFAIAFLLVYPLLELAALLFKKEYLAKTAQIMLIIGVVSAIGAVLTGNQAGAVAAMWEDQGAMIPFGAITAHEEYANITLWFFTAILLFRTMLVLSKKFYGIYRYIIVVLALIGTYFVYETGELGGDLVYKHGVGTELKKEEILE